MNRDGQPIVLLDFSDLPSMVQMAIVRRIGSGRISNHLVVIRPAYKRLRMIGQADTYAHAIAAASRASPAKVWVVSIRDIGADLGRKRNENGGDAVPAYPYGCLVIRDRHAIYLPSEQ